MREREREIKKEREGFSFSKTKEKNVYLDVKEIIRVSDAVLIGEDVCSRDFKQRFQIMYVVDLTLNNDDIVCT